MSKSLDGVLIKAAHKPEFYSEDNISEFMKCADQKTGPAYFLSNYFYIQHPVRGKIQYAPFDYQIELADVYHNYRFSINLLSRQLGKTTTAAGYLLWYAMFVPDSTILVAAHKYSGAQEIMSRIRYAYETMPNFIRAGSTSYNKGSLEFDNGSRIISTATTENTGRGLSISLLYVDEFAFVRNTIAKEFWTSMSPTLATGGKAIITSTPNSDEDQFWQIWIEANKNVDEFGNTTDLGKNGFKAFTALWSQHPDRDDQWADEEKGRIGQERFDREHNCRPIVFEETLINGTHLLSMEGREPVERQGQVRWYRKPKKDHMYLIALDPSLGTGGDYAAMQIFELPTFEQVGEWQHNRTPIQAQIRILQSIAEYIHDIVGTVNDIYYSVENNTIGEASLIAISELGEENIKGVFLSEPRKTGSTSRYRKGYTTTNASKLSACAKFKQLVEGKKMKINSKNLITELKTFVASGNSYEARTGDTDDLVLSALLIIRMMQSIQNYDAKIDDKMRSLDEMSLPMPFIMC
jgi:hypothetical protein